MIILTKGLQVRNISQYLRLLTTQYAPTFVLLHRFYAQSKSISQDIPTAIANIVINVGDPSYMWSPLDSLTVVSPVRHVDRDQGHFY